MTSAIGPEDERWPPVHAAFVGAGASLRLMGVQRWIHIAIVPLASSGCGTLPGGRLRGVAVSARWIGSVRVRECATAYERTPRREDVRMTVR